MLVNQKASYLFTYPPIFDTKDKNINSLIMDTLGDSYAKKCKDLCVNASNSGIAWLHYWVNDTGFNYAVVPSTQVIPIWSKKLDKKLLAVLRYYTDFDDGRYTSIGQIKSVKLFASVMVKNILSLKI